MHRLISVAVAVSAAAAFGAGCGGDSSDDEPTNQPPAREKAELNGAYEATFSGSEQVADENPGPEPGRWALRIAPPNTSGTYIASTSPDADVDGGLGLSFGTSVRVAGDIMSLGPGSPICTAVRGRARYRFALDGGSLRLTKVSDACGERAAFLTAHKWKRVSDDPEAKLD
jgi:hypothetical protein